MFQATGCDMMRHSGFDDVCQVAATKAAFLAKMPHAVVLRSAAGAIRILVTSADFTRPGAKYHRLTAIDFILQTFTDCT